MKVLILSTDYSKPDEYISLGIFILEIKST